jgi:hypothetical protein
MLLKFVPLLCLAVMPSALFGQAPEPNAMLLSQAYDRCMTTFAVRLTRTDASDEAIYSAATEGCGELQLAMFAAMRREIPQPDVETIISQITDSAEPNFMALLNRIRTDRAAREQQQ